MWPPWAGGTFLISRLVAEHEDVWPVVERRMDELLEPAIELIHELFAAYDPVPFGLQLETFVDYAMASSAGATRGSRRPGSRRWNRSTSKEEE